MKTESSIICENLVLSSGHRAIGNQHHCSRKEVAELERILKIRHESSDFPRNSDFVFI